MDGSKLIAIVVGVVGALVGVYFRESFRRSVRQKLLASKLEAQVREMILGVLTTRFSEILAVAEVWRKERLSALSEQGPQVWGEVERKWKGRLEQIKGKISEGHQEVDQALTRAREAYRKLPEKLFAYQIREFELLRDLLSSSTGFLSEDEAAEISWDTVACIVSFRTALERIIKLQILFALSSREIQDPQLEESRSTACECLEEGIRLSQQLTAMRDKTKMFRTRSLLRLTFENMLGRH